MKNVLVIPLIALAAMLSACGGGSSSPVPELSQVEKANKLVRGLNYYEYSIYEWTGHYNSDGTKDYDWVTHYDYSTQYAVAKGVTAQNGFAVLMDTKAGKYYALNVGNFYSKSAVDSTYYNNTDAKKYQNDTILNGQAYFNLRLDADGMFSYILPNGTVGLRFQAQELSADEVDVNEVQAAVYKQNVALLTGNLEKMGVPESKAEEGAVAIIAARAENNGAPDLSKAQLDKVMKKVTGLTLGDAMAAVSGSAAEQTAAFEKAKSSGLIESPAQGLMLISNAAKALGL